MLKTENTQPAMLAFNVGCFWLLKEEYGIVPDVVWTQLGRIFRPGCVWCFGFRGCLETCKSSRIAHGKACPAGAGGMAAVIALVPKKYWLCAMKPEPGELWNLPITTAPDRWL